jgi:peptidoglycan hydrolase CwlO-like protein|tara:strand:+ start:456 stop:776 length:321 start_codon:yes stop_codon:yes gene_type:complete
MKYNTYLIIVLLGVILICSCLSNIKIKKIIEKYQNENNASSYLHLDAVQNLTMEQIQQQIDRNNEMILTIQNDSNEIQNNINEINQRNTELEAELQRLVNIAQSLA